MPSEFFLSQGAGQKLEFAVNRCGGSTADIEWLSAGQNFELVMRLARGEAKIVMTPSEDDTIIRVNRSVKPVYPDWVAEVLHPDLELSGPTEYNIGQVEQWLHEGQKKGGCIKGQQIYEFLKENKMLESCLGLADLHAIQAEGIDFFQEHFDGKLVFGWKSIVRHYDGDLCSPRLYDSGGQVMLGWLWLGDSWYFDDPALRLAS
jgi:hypothetical protein